MYRRYKHTGLAALLGEFHRLISEVDICVTQERNSFLYRHLTNALNANKDMRKEIQKDGLLPKQKEEELNGFTPGELNTHLAGISRGFPRGRMFF